jgi:heme/copper-type cytochrome/quinol oxidase subunit 3
LLKGTEVETTMAHATTALPGHETTEPSTTITEPRHPPVTPGKVAMWLFLATEVMFFTGLIGSYIVLRTGSTHTSYSNLFQPGTDLTRLKDSKGIFLESVDSHAGRTAIAEIIARVNGISEHDALHLVESAPHLVVYGTTAEKAAKVAQEITAAGGKATLEPLKTHNWPLPYDETTNPLSIDLTAANTFILICSSVTMVLAVSAIQRGDKRRCSLLLLATVLIGSTFLSVQIYEYYQLMFGHHYPPGISASAHFRPSSSLFASCFFTMTGFHGAHVTGGVLALICIWISSLMGSYTRHHHSPVELVGLYWHFVDLVWIILFTVVYLI